MSQNSPNGATASGSKKSATASRSLSPGALAASRPGRIGTPGARLSGGGGTGRLGSSRLPSFKGQRDLTLGGATPRAASAAIPGAAATDNKKKFVPNLKVQRRKEEMKKEVKEERVIDIQTGRKGHVKDKHGGKAKSLSSSGEGPAPKGRSKPELIQTMAGSVFSEGVSGEGIRRKVGGGYGGGGGGRDSEPLRRPILSKESKGSVDKEAEEKRLKALLRDDFISDLSSEGLYVPVQLPMIDTGKLFLAEEKDKLERGEEGDEEDVIQSTRKPRANRILDSDDEDDPPDPKVQKEKPATKDKPSGKPAAEDADLTFQDLVRQQRGDLIFIQLPDHLPGIAMPPVKTEPGTGGDDRADGEGGRLCHLKDLPEGYLGKIQVRRSGKTQLKIGDALLDIDLGTQVGFLQDLVSVDTGEEAGASRQEVGDMTVLGRVRHRMVITPDWDHLFKAGGSGGPGTGLDDSDE